MTENVGKLEISRFASALSFARMGIMKAGLWPGFVLALGSFLFVELKILDHSRGQYAKGDLWLALSLPLIISGAACQEYRNLEGDLLTDSNSPAVLYAVKKHILALMSLTFSGIFLLLCFYGRS